MTVIERLQQEGVNTQRLCLDSRQIAPGDIFVALHGAKQDGRSFIGDAVRHGASAVLYDTDSDIPIEISVPSIAVQDLGAMLGEIANLIYGKPSEKLNVIGVTGTNGKTSVSQWIAQTLAVLGQRCAMMGTLGNGFLDQLQESPNTTPDAIAVHSALSYFSTQGAVACAMEVSSIGLDQGRVNAVAFDTAVFTNLTRDHLDYHNDMESYAAAKARLFAMPGLKTAVLNLDDPFGRELAQSLRGKLRTIGYSLDPRTPQLADQVLTANTLCMTANGIAFSVDGKTIEANVFGRFNASNLLAVFGALVAQGFSGDNIASALTQITPPPGRLQAAVSANKKANPLVVVDYAHTPDALEKALTTLREIALPRSGKLVCVFGCGGDRDPGKRPLMGAIAERLADRVWVTSDNPRTEDPEWIASQIVAGMRGGQRIVLDRAEAIQTAVATADEHDVVLIAGKGHEAYQEIAGIKHPFSDIGTAQRALEQPL